ncbi:hypothetical protein N7522_001255 [Penicillium canescens]|uniref:Uncharacterized protein n=1 Tax=Penicillium canescens TaxID=5083 RepID=A0AAD6IN24_PENCN|nr:uncharacterized protein N7446_008327 [Penicillium canescens]KAJ6019188.1 hypothetical protein N7522_001255 [Penicillium canescens]KAJ6033383.1 hypothetical protein N7444_011154 [Penicillium canescens]KAJ6057427.1 hypothetical protein N7460_000701 [Penicillium canescens]KAJ6058744.1 hypothetical protein N7446_008327 [Penicillium canescens]
MMPTLSFSPKRKREPSESDCYSPSASPTSTVSTDSFQDPRFREDELGRHSPRAAVAGRFGELAIRGELQSDATAFPHSQQSLASSAQLCAFDSAVAQNMPEALPASSESSDRQATLSEAPATQYQPTSLPTPSKKSATFPHKHINSSPSKRKPRVSPPLADTPSEDPLVWHDSEITGHNPSDPNDDGYGINGIGFKPTASIAWARSQKRQKQVAEWKNREAREARERRRERRRDGIELDKIHSIHDGAIQKRVKFDV